MGQMKREEYISNNEMSEFIVLAGSMDGVNNLIQKTQDKEWLKYLKTAMTNLNKVLLGRFGCITEKKRQNTIRRRLKDCEVTWTSKDGLYNVAAPNVEKMTAPLNDFYHICEVVATEHCIGCDIEKYKTCQIRKWFESCGCPAMVGNPGDKCQYWVDPKAVEKLEEVKEEETAKLSPDEYTEEKMPCIVCGNEITIKRLKYNGHVRGHCDKCGMSIMS